MVGNIFEWCSDYFYVNNPESRTSKFSGEYSDLLLDMERVIRGGSFNDYWRVARCAFRNKFNPKKNSNFIGFRVMH
jgi:formylglycine-generating enzyme required for sulfatase activity